MRSTKTRFLSELQRAQELIAEARGLLQQASRMVHDARNVRHHAALLRMMVRITRRRLN